ncbi:hypothetical protein BS78_06G208100 [Paspalum vaginatum]|nr:hypothetical protein BS78_06G208100 [Paspalum vaginatum]
MDKDSERVEAASNGDEAAPVATGATGCEESTEWGEVEAAESTGWGEVESTGWGEVQATGWGEVEATGWGDEEPGGDDDAEAVADHDDDTAQDEDNVNNEEDEEDVGNRREEEDNVSDDDGYDGQYDDEDVDEEDAYYSSIAEETERDGVVQPVDKNSNSLDDLFRPPYELMYCGSFHGAKVHAAREDQLLLVNLQTRAGAGDFPSQLQNRDLWANETVSKVVKENFVFMLLQKRRHYSYSDECSKVSSFYKLPDDDQLPAVLVLDPITGELLAKRSGAMTPDEFMEFVAEHAESKPSTLSKPSFVKKTPTSVGAGSEEEEQEWASASAPAAVEVHPAPASSEPAAEAGEQEPEIPDEDSAADGGACSEQEPEISEDDSAADGACSEQERAPVPESPAEAVDDDEPMEGENMYSLRIRFPDGTMVAKEFGCNRRVASLFAFCRSAVHGRAEAEKTAFRIMRFVGRALEAIQDDGGATFEDLGLNRAAVSVVFDT